MTEKERVQQDALARMMGLAGFLKDCKDLNICPDYLRIEQRMIELYDQYQKSKEMK